MRKSLQTWEKGQALYDILSAIGCTLVPRPSQKSKTLLVYHRNLGKVAYESPLPKFCSLGQKPPSTLESSNHEQIYSSTMKKSPNHQHLNNKITISSFLKSSSSIDFQARNQKTIEKLGPNLQYTFKTSLVGSVPNYVEEKVPGGDRIRAPRKFLSPIIWDPGLTKEDCHASYLAWFWHTPLVLHTTNNKDSRNNG
jgi:hypothetical protein